MTEDEDLPPASRGTLRDEAADWFAVMRGPEADARQSEFQQWLGASALHREAYNRIAETFSLGKALKTGMPTASVGSSSGTRSREKSRRPIVMASLAAVLIVTGLWTGRTLLTEPSREVQAPSVAAAGNAAHEGGAPLQVTTKVGEIRQFHLADGSVATLDTDSIVLVSLGEKARELTLIKGRARFEVAHEARPFLVSAGGGMVKAVGTIFDVALVGGGRVDVRLLRGAVDVAISADGAHREPSQRLMPGKVLSFGGQSAPQVSDLSASTDANWPKGLRDFDGVALGRVLADANRYSNVPLRAGSPDVADIRISGTFRVDNGAVLAANIAEVLGLAEVSAPNEIVLARECPATSQKNCKPPS
jgi:transmembrane sensor